ncbi:MAG: deoxynucleoside kinase, partial [Bacteroidota bacterium]
LMTTRDFNNYTQLFKKMTSQIEPPDLLIYLRAGIGTLVKHIEARGRDYEGSMSLDYLKSLNKRYEDWISTYKEGNILIIDVDSIDFAKDPEDLGEVVNLVSSKLHGLFGEN